MLLKVEGVAKSFGTIHALRDFYLTVSTGEVVGIIGPNGAGKSTLVNVVSGVYRPDYGRILFKGKRVEGLKPHELCKLGIARVNQIPRLFKEMTVLDNVVVACVFGSRSKKGVGEAYRLSLGYLKLVGLQDKKDTLCRDLNVAESKMVEVARALATEPSLILVDEAVSGLNPEESKQVVEVVNMLRTAGVSVIWVEHAVDILAGVADRVVVMDKGAKVAEGKPLEVMNDGRVLEVYMGAGEGA